MFICKLHYSTGYLHVQVRKPCLKCQPKNLQSSYVHYKRSGSVLKQVGTEGA